MVGKAMYCFIVLAPTSLPTHRPATYSRPPPPNTGITVLHLPSLPFWSAREILLNSLNSRFVGVFCFDILTALCADLGLKWCDLWQKQDVLGEPDCTGGRLVTGWVLPALVPISPSTPTTIRFLGVQISFRTYQGTVVQ